MNILGVRYVNCWIRFILKQTLKCQKHNTKLNTCIYVISTTMNETNYFI